MPFLSYSFVNLLALIYLLTCAQVKWHTCLLVNPNKEMEFVIGPHTVYVNMSEFMI